MTATTNPNDARQVTFAMGSRQVVTWQHAPGFFDSRLYVNGGETATPTSSRHKTLAGAKRWAERRLING
jgi:hypothetical protein